MISLLCCFYATYIKGDNTHVYVNGRHFMWSCWYHTWTITLPPHNIFLYCCIFTLAVKGIGGIRGWLPLATIHKGSVELGKWWHGHTTGHLQSRAGYTQRHRRSRNWREGRKENTLFGRVHTVFNIQTLPETCQLHTTPGYNCSHELDTTPLANGLITIMRK